MPSRGRPYADHTKLGKLMKARGLRVHDVCMAADVYPRSMSDYLAGTKKPSTAMTFRLSKYFRLPPSEILEDEYPYTKDMAEKAEMKKQIQNHQTERLVV